MRYQHIIQKVYCEPWAITRPAWYAIETLVARHVIKAEKPLEDFLGQPLPQMDVDENGIVTIPVIGSMVRGAGLIEKSCGVVSHEDISDDIDKAVSLEPMAILLNIDSPGGTLEGTPELAEKIAATQAKGTPVYVFAQNACSAAYYIAAGTNGIFAPHTGTIGNVGVIMEMLDQSAAMAMKGLKVEQFTSGSFKGTGSPFVPLTKEQREFLQNDVDRAGAEFRAFVKRYRKIGDEDLEGQWWSGEQAIAKGFVDSEANNIAEAKQLIIAAHRLNKE